MKNKKTAKMFFIKSIIIFLIIIFIYVVITVLLNVYKLKQKESKKIKDFVDTKMEEFNKKMDKRSNKPLEESALILDKPQGFGYKCLWFAIKSDDKEKIAELLKLIIIGACNWEIGIQRAYELDVYITPKIGDWTLVYGTGLLKDYSDQNINNIKSVLRKLSKEFGEAQYFCTHRVVEYHCWMKAINGEVERIYSYLGESGENILIEGKPSNIETQFNLINTFSEEAKEENYFNREDIIIPDETLLMEIANNWSVNPSELENRNDIQRELGLLAK